jgi:hypothetical protein
MKHLLAIFIILGMVIIPYLIGYGIDKYTKTKENILVRFLIGVIVSLGLIYVYLILKDALPFIYYTIYNKL